MTNTVNTMPVLEQVKPMFQEYEATEEHTFLGSVNMGGVGYDLYVRVGSQNGRPDFTCVNKDSLGNLRVQTKKRANIMMMKGAHPLRVAMFIIDIEYNLQ